MCRRDRVEARRASRRDGAHASSRAIAIAKIMRRRSDARRGARARRATVLAAMTSAACLVHAMKTRAFGARASADDALVAVGDAHGDPDAMFEALALAGVTRERGRGWWRRPGEGAGARATCVQTGDLVDRGERSIEAVDEVERLTREANAVGDEFVSLLGNHELMTLQGDHRFASRDELTALGRSELEREGVVEADKGVGLGVRAYFYAGKLKWRQTFAKGSTRGDVLREKPWAAVRGRGRCATAFSHAGLLPEHLFGRDDVDELNARGAKLLAVDEVGRDDPLLLDRGPMWTRTISMGDESEACALAAEVIRRLGVRRMVVGHTVTKSGKIETRCDGLIHMIDVGMSKAYGGSPSVWMCTESEGPMAISRDSRVPLEN